jgi:anti-sigma regulatory factor (Ser/Thr protein kinase)
MSRPAPRPLTDGLCGTVPSHPKFLPMIRSITEEAATLAGIRPEDARHLMLAVTEAWTNVIRHAYGGAEDQRIDFRFEAAPGILRIEIEDWATWVDPRKITSRPLDDIRPGGLGVHLIQSTMDDVAYTRNEQGGTTLKLVKRSAPTEDRPT